MTVRPVAPALQTQHCVLTAVNSGLNELFSQYLLDFFFLFLDSCMAVPLDTV